MAVLVRKSMAFRLLVYMQLLGYFQVKSELNLFISQEETRKILGLDGELNYIRQGHENKNAIKYELPIPSDVNDLVMVWQNKPLLPQSTNKQQQLIETIVYSLNVTAHSPEVLRRPFVNITQTGKIPLKEEAFSIKLACVAGKDGNVLVHLQLNLTQFNKTSGLQIKKSLNFNYNKLCRKEIPLRMEEPAHSAQDNDGDILLDQTNVFYISIGVACSAILLVATGIATLHVQSMPKVKTTVDNRDIVSQSDTASQPASLPTQRVTHPVGFSFAHEKQKKEIRVKLRDISIARSLVTLGNVVQEGAFGRVYVGTFISSENGEEQRIFVKTVTDQASPEQINIFLIESSRLKRTNHRNVLPIMHCCLDEESPPLVLYPYMNRGNLKNYLRLSRTAEPLSKTLTTRDIVLMAIQVARGLQYLTRRRIVHKDIATRNCVVDEELTVKITDNALARDFFPGDYHCLGDNENRPIRWMSAESLEYNKFSPYSDVWSYGVFLWELTTLAQTPYANVDPFEMLRYLKSGYRLPQPVNCPDDLFTVMACCWALSEEERPHFSQVVACLDSFYSTLNAFI